MDKSTLHPRRRLDPSAFSSERGDADHFTKPPGHNYFPCTFVHTQPNHGIRYVHKWSVHTKQYFLSCDTKFSLTTQNEASLFVLYVQHKFCVSCKQTFNNSDYTVLDTNERIFKD
jgi:hypothetical protein